ncbi:ImmA/IrrE family metallo-endopeptidase [Facklamia hominis]
MTPLEKLMAEYDDELSFVFKKDMPDELKGLFVGKTVYINANLNFEECLTVLAEEIGHYETLAPGTDISDYHNMKLENKGRDWGREKLVPIEELRKFIKGKESVEGYELAEKFGVSGDYIEEVVSMYRTKGAI